VTQQLQKSIDFRRIELYDFHLRRAHWLSCVNLEDFTVALKFANQVIMSVKNYQAYRPGTGVELHGAPEAGRQTAALPAGALRRRRGRAGRYNARNKFRN
jgi:hypothetical protein